MKIIHFCLSNYFNDGLLYQENELVRHHVSSGHDVLVVASTEEYDSLGNITYTSPRTYVGEEGATVIRLPYTTWLPRSISRKVRMYPKVKQIMMQFRPDVIIFHGSAAYELFTVSSFARDNPSVVLKIDSHSDHINSARGWASREILHKRFYAPILRKALGRSGKLLCVSQTVIDFARDIYQIPSRQLQFYPLGGKILTENEIAKLRKSTRDKYNISENAILLLQTGKINRQKKLNESLRAFTKTQNDSLRFIISGVLQEDIREECNSLIQADDRIKFIGWQPSNELTNLLCATDVYVQPGTQSVTMQQAICCGCAIIVDDIPAHDFYVKGNGWVISSEEELTQIFDHLTEDNIAKFRSSSLEFAKSHLDYEKLAQQLLA